MFTISRLMVMLPCAQVCIERWLQQGNRTCPVTGMRLRHLELTPNFALRVAVQVGRNMSQLFHALLLGTCSLLLCAGW